LNSDILPTLVVVAVYGARGKEYNACGCPLQEVYRPVNIVALKRPAICGAAFPIVFDVRGSGRMHDDIV
jgi:hypothetical protein